MLFFHIFYVQVNKEDYSFKTGAMGLQLAVAKWGCNGILWGNLNTVKIHPIKVSVFATDGLRLLSDKIVESSPQR